MNKPDTQLLALLEHGSNEALAPSVVSNALPEFFPPESPFSPLQRSFLNGLFLGRMSETQSQVGVEAAQAPLSIFYASQTGTAESLSKKLRKLAGQYGFAGSVAELDSISLDELTTCSHVLIIAATCGEGEPPDNAYNFYTSLMDNAAPELPPTLNFSVCGLGDSNYAYFNQVAQTLDHRLAQLGANRVSPLVRCDVDYDSAFAGWTSDVFKSDSFVEAAGQAGEAPKDDDDSAPAYDRKRPFLATLLSNESLSLPGSEKTVNHVELSLAGCGEPLEFEVGDALGVWPLNEPSEVEKILCLAGLDGRDVVRFQDRCVPLAQALRHSLDLVTVTDAARQLLQVTNSEDLQLVDLLQARSKNDGCETIDAQLLVDGLRPMQPRLYSISSSPNAHPGEVHLTIGEVHYELNGTDRHGVASNFLGNQLAPGSALGVYVQKSAHFGVPADDATPMIMIGPGTGIAPFRAFLEERELRNASGDNWLFFGDQHESTDFLYRDELLAWRERGVLNELSLAWSRDSAEKVYVQHLIAQQGRELFSWLERGAAVYVCGDAARMAKDVEAALLDVICEHGQMNESAATDYMQRLRQAGRYQRDVY